MKMKKELGADITGSHNVNFSQNKQSNKQLKKKSENDSIKIEKNKHEFYGTPGWMFSNGTMIRI